MGHLRLLTTGWSDAVWAEDDNKRVKCQASSQTIRPLYFFLTRGTSAPIHYFFLFLRDFTHRETSINSSHSLALQFCFVVKKIQQSPKTCTRKAIFCQYIQYLRDVSKSVQCSHHSASSIADSQSLQYIIPNAVKEI